jgi:hypothetical protein
MNKKKLIFIILLWIIIILWTLIIIIGAKSSDKKQNKINTNDFKIWLYDINKDQFETFINNFKKTKKYNSFNPKIESFSDYETYNLALASAFAKWEGPDIFMLNNNEKSLFLEQAIWINPEIISPDDIRTYFKWFFANDLIYTIGEWKEKKRIFSMNTFLIWTSLNIF